MKYLSIIVLLLAFPSFADEPVRSINVTGEATQMLEPDQAILSVSLNSQHRDLQTVKRQQDEKLNALYNVAGELKLEKKKLKTRYVRLNPEYRYKDGKRIFQGYRGDIGVDATLDDVTQVGEVMQRLIESGIDEIDQVRYVVKNEKQLREAMMVDALTNAQAKARVMAEAVGVTLGAPISISEQAIRGPQLVHRAAKMMSVAAADAVAPPPPTGEQEIRAQVSVQFELVK